MGLPKWLKARIIAHEVRGMLKNTKKWAILISILATGAAALAAGLGNADLAAFITSVQGHAHLTPSDTGASWISVEQIGLIVGGLLQLYTVGAKILSDVKKAKAKKA
jgi:hypothetical protein